MLHILRRRAVTETTGLQKSAIYAAIAAGSFPKPVRLGPHSVGWLQSEIEAWIEARIVERNGSCGE